MYTRKLFWKRHISTREALAAALLLPLMLPAAGAHAEGTAQLGVKQALQSSTVMAADIVTPANEKIVWTGSGKMTVTDPAGKATTVSSGGAVNATAGLAGAYKVTVDTSQSVDKVWDISVRDKATNKEFPGRISSKIWKLSAGSYAQSTAFSASVYALAPGGTAGNDAIIEMKTQGLAGNVFDLAGNQSGVAGKNSGRSVPLSGNSYVPQYPLYLNPPAIAKGGRSFPRSVA